MILGIIPLSESCLCFAGSSAPRVHHCLHRSDITPTLIIANEFNRPACASAYADTLNANLRAMAAKNLQRSQCNTRYSSINDAYKCLHLDTNEKVLIATGNTATANDLMAVLVVNRLNSRRGTCMERSRQ
jgi:hypothetical protein